MCIPFTYLIGWPQHSLFYYGVRYARNCSPADLWTTYFTSSADVKRLRKTLGEPTVIEVRKTFADRSTACLWEHKVLRRLNAVKREDFINRSLGGALFWSGMRQSDEHREKRRKAWIGRKHSEESRAKMSESHKGQRRVGWHHTEETKQKLREYQQSVQPIKGIKRSEETKNKQRHANIGANNPNFGKRWWNNGTQQILAVVCPVGWARGRL